jgi:hypothetical protein
MGQGNDRSIETDKAMAAAKDVHQIPDGSKPYHAAAGFLLHLLLAARIAPGLL